MSERWAKICSTVFHPVFLLAYIVLLLIFTPTNHPATAHAPKPIALAAACITATTIIPCLLMLLLRRLHLIHSLTMETTRERRLPYLFNIATYTITNLLFTQYLPSHPLCSFFGGLLILQSILLIINEFWKISLHTAGVGACVGIATAMLLLENTAHLTWTISLSINLLLSIVLLMARQSLSAHSNAQLLLGWLLGGLTMGTVMIL